MHHNHGRITIVPGATNDREVIKKAVAGCDGVLTVLELWGVQQYSSGSAQAVLDHLSLRKCFPVMINFLFRFKTSKGL